MPTWSSRAEKEHAAKTVRRSSVMTKREEEFLGTVDVREHRQVHWPIIGVFARRFVDQLELRQYKRQLLATGRWKVIRAVPQRKPSGDLSTHVFDLFGTPESAPVGRQPRPRQPRSGLVPWNIPVPLGSRAKS